MLRLAIVGLVAASVGLGCTRDNADPAPRSERARREPARPGPPARPASSAGIDPAPVAATIERWRAAQNAGDFAAYAALYSRRMAGIKRVGQRTATFDHAGWMTDRRRMFGRPMTVGVSDLTIKTASASAVATFTQTFAQGKFHDRGSKQIVLSLDPGTGALLIAREEMLLSVVGAPPVGAAGSTEQFHYLIYDGNTPLYVLLDQGTFTPRGSPMMTGGMPDMAEANVDESTLDPRWQAWKGATVTLRGGESAPCQAQVTRLAVVVGVTPHFSQEQEWRDAGIEGEQLAKAVWKLGGEPVLVAVLDPPPCEGALWAQLGTRPITTYEHWIDPDMTSAVQAAFRRVPAWKEEQSRHRSSGGTGNWDGLDDGDDGQAIKLFRHPDTGSVWAVVRVDVGDDCDHDGFAATLTAVFEHTGGAAPSGWKLQFSDALDHAIEAVHDIDGDRDPELTGMQQLIDRVPGPGNAFQLDRFAFPYYDCGC